MKRTITIPISALLLFILSACNNNSNTISVAELTEREVAILDSTSNHSFVFDFNLDKEYKEVTVWIEKYESGNLVEDKIGEFTTNVEDDGTMIFTTAKTNPTQFNIAINSKEGGGSVNAYDQNTNNLDDRANVQSYFKGENISIEEEIVLGSICYPKDRNMNSLSSDFYEDVDGHLNELEKYDVVYLFKADFIKWEFV